MSDSRSDRGWRADRKRWVLLALLITLALIAAFLLRDSRTEHAKHELEPASETTDASSTPPARHQTSRRETETPPPQNVEAAASGTRRTVTVVEQESGQSIEGARVLLLPHEEELRAQRAWPDAWLLGVTDKSGVCSIDADDEPLNGRLVLIERAGFLSSAFDLEPGNTRAELPRGASITIRTIPALSSLRDSLRVTFWPMQDQGGLIIGPSDRIVTTPSGRHILRSVAHDVVQEGQKLDGFVSGAIYRVYARLG